MQIPIKVWFFKFNSSVKRDDQFEKNPTVFLVILEKAFYVSKMPVRTAYLYKTVKKFSFSRRSYASAQTKVAVLLQI